MLNFNTQTFLKDYWQKKPLVIKGGIAQFDDPLDEHDLAGLAELEEVDSRIISQQNGEWHVEQGPFEDFEPLLKGDWTLLAQGVNQYIPEAAYLLDAFSFIPHWRMDDLMVSYSVANAGVGPHIDQYDVFIIQGRGSRRWQVGNKKEYATVMPHPKLKQIAMFEPIIDEVLEPGDIIYIPPGFPHNGVALEPCLNYSVGFRAPNQIQLLDNFTNHCIEHQKANERYQDPSLAYRKYSAEMTRTEMNAMKKLVKAAIDSNEFEQWFLEFNSGLAYSCEEGEADYDTDTPSELIQAPYFDIERSLDTQTIFLESEHGSLHFAINGQSYQFEGVEADIHALKALLSERITDANLVANLVKIPQLHQWLSLWVELGYWEDISNSDAEFEE